MGIGAEPRSDVQMASCFTPQERHTTDFYKDWIMSGLRFQHFHFWRKGKRMSLQLERTVCNDHLDLKISGDNNNDGDHAHGLLSCVIV